MSFFALFKIAVKAFSRHRLRALLTALGQPQYAEDRAWYPVRDSDGDTGWVAAEYVLPIS